MKRLNYAALGDSAAAAPGVPDRAEPLGCFKSTHDYPSVLARRLAPTSFADVTCSGATTADITSQPQQTSQGPVPPQIDAIHADTDLVSITIGGNDIGIATDAAQCRTSSLDTPLCSTKFVQGGVDRLSVAINQQAPAWAEMIDVIRGKAPNARIVVVGYGTYVRPGGCFAELQAHPQDADYFQSKIDEMDDKQKQIAAEKGIDYFDIRPLSQGHDVCAPPDDRYFEGFVVTHPAAPLHPNSFGAAAVGNALADYLGLR
ncbi:MAG: SGNH/GDSL hydrolase family protein [Mycobacteriaceae bacterium]|nr:SGNH/GDSL hydrolase family protein [Mycobacteriaceae bacterium]MBV9638709.1 SGNH/GDSL hydrolase family protein [Mycobacteriaceae bacterium]